MIGRILSLLVFLMGSLNGEGLEALATQAAELGKTATQQERFYQAVRNVVGTGLMVFGASKLKGAVKGLRKAPTTVAKDAGKKAASAPCSHAEAELKVRDGHIKQPNVVDASHFSPDSLIKPLDKRGRVLFDGVEFRAVRDLSHMSVEDLKVMYKRGKNPRDFSFERLDGHHYKQLYHRETGAFIVEIPDAKHCISNRVQHPLGNDGGLTKAERRDWDKVRKAFNKERARQELLRRDLL